MDVRPRGRGRRHRDSRFCLPHETARCVWRCAKATALSVGEGVAWVASNAILLRVICSSTPAGGHGLAWRPYPCCVRLSARSPLLRRTHDEAQSHTPRGRCVRSWPASPSTHATLASRLPAEHYRAPELVARV